jgi:hypothetical protein
LGTRPARARSVSGEDQSRVVLVAGVGTTATIEGLTITNGSAQLLGSLLGDGGGVLNVGGSNLTLIEVNVSGNTATMTNAGHTLKVTKLGAGSFGQYSYRSNSDFNNGFRIDQTASGGSQRFLNVISIDNAATSITGSGETATVRLSSGKTVEVTFNRDAVGATLKIDGQTTTLGAGVDNVNAE